MEIKVKEDLTEALCPHCNEWDELLWDEQKQLYVLICCRTYGIHNEIKKPVPKRKKRKPPKRKEKK